MKERLKKIVIATDSFKGCLSAAEVVAAAREGVERVLPDVSVEPLPVSDGGEGMLDVFSHALGAKRVAVAVLDPLMRPVTAHYAIAPDRTTAIIEMAQASGLTLVEPELRDAWKATTFGTGQLIADAVKRGCKRLVVGLGGSATTDGGRGMLEALGIVLRDDGGFDTRRSLLKTPVEVIVACDVDAPLLGRRGAAQVFAPQKGASPRMVGRLERRLAHWADCVAAHVGRDFKSVAGAGAAGGTGFALLAFAGAEIRPGIEVLLDLTRFDDLLTDADLVITGEGGADRQTMMGKAPVGVLRHAARRGVPTVLLAGRVADREALLEAGFADVRCINPPGASLAECLRPEVASRNIAATAACVVTSR